MICIKLRPSEGKRSMGAIGLRASSPRTSASDAVDGSSTGIAMCHIVVAIQERRMSASGGGFKRSPQHIQQISQLEFDIARSFVAARSVGERWR